MCAICRRIEATEFIDEEEALALIAEGIGNGQLAKHFDGVLDRVLGTEMTERNREVEEAWEKGNRGRQDA
jgi:hypothetical protein